MVELNDDLFQTETFQKELESIIRNGDPGVLTAAFIRKELEKKLGLEENALKPWKKTVNAQIDTTFIRVSENAMGQQEVKSQQPEKPDSSDVADESGDKAKGSVISDSDMPAEKDVMDEDDEEQQEESDRESSMSVATSENEAPAKKKRAVQKQPRKKRESGKEKKSSSTEETIKRLKMYINKCGVRKVWQKELADCKTMKDQVDKLKHILTDLGVEGRPTIEKCQKVKADRELKAEIASLDTENIIDTDGRRTRHQGPKRKRRAIASEDEDEDEFEESKTKKSAPARDNGLDLSFLGDQSDSD